MEMMKAQGFVDIKRVEVQWPVGSWPKGSKNKAMGRLVLENVMKEVPGIATALFTRQLGWRKEEGDAFVEECLRDLAMKERHYYFDM